jgi:DNA-binding NarL/FixJ family response regulator
MAPPRRVEIMPGPYHILLAEDHILLRQELAKLINRTAGLKVVAEVEDGIALFQSLDQSLPDLIILDIYMPHLQAMEATRLIKLRFPEVKVLIMVMDHEPEYATQAWRVGADGLLPKQHLAMELSEAVKAVQAGNFYLSQQFQGEKSLIAQIHQAQIPMYQDTAR